MDAPIDPALWGELEGARETRIDPALQPLVRDHRAFLRLARDVSLWAERDVRIRADRDYVSAFLSLWDERVAPHFRAEEELIYTAYRQVFLGAERETPLLEDDHARLRIRARQVAAAVESAREDDLRLLARTLATALAEHIRFEERVLLPALGRLLDRDELDDVGERLLRRGIGP